jgi:hypothetical protein
MTEVCFRFVILVHPYLWQLPLVQMSTINLVYFQRFRRDFLLSQYYCLPLQTMKAELWLCHLKKMLLLLY